MEGDFDSECRGGEEVYKVRVSGLALVCSVILRLGSSTVDAER